MGLLKKKPTELDATAAAAILPAVESAPAAEAPAAAAPNEAPSIEASADEGAPEAAPVVDASEEDGVVASAPDGADALLSVFGSTQHESADQAILLGMAGDIELADLMDEVQMVASALNIAVNRG